MKKIVFILSLLLVLLLTACDTNSVTDTKNNSPIEETQSHANTDKYIIQTVFYQIYEEDLQKYRYRITNGNDVLVEDIKTGTAPQIEDKGDGILRLHLGYGANAFSVKYLNVYNKTVSEEFNPYSIYADYINIKTKEYYIAYFKPEEKPKLYINGFFDSSDFSTELDLDFSMATCEKIIFLNEKEIYLEYIDSNSESIKKVVNYQAAGNTTDEESLTEILIREIDGAYAEELKMPESSSTGGMVDLADKYTKKWQQVADEYYNRIIEFDGIITPSENYYSSDDLHAFVSNMKTNWEQYHQQQCENYGKTLQAIYSGGTIVGPIFADYKYEMQKEWALQIVSIYEQLYIQ